MCSDLSQGLSSIVFVCICAKEATEFRHWTTSANHDGTSICFFFGRRGLTRKGVRHRSNAVSKMSLRGGKDSVPLSCLVELIHVVATLPAANQQCSPGMEQRRVEPSGVQVTIAVKLHQDEEIESVSM